MKTLMQAYDEYADNKMASKEALKEITRKVKDFLKSIKKDKDPDFRKCFKGYLRHTLIVNNPEFGNGDQILTSPAAQEFYRSKIEDTVDSEQIREYVSFYEDKKKEAKVYNNAMKDIVEDYCDTNDMIQKPNLRTFFNYRFQKQVKGESPIDSIEEYEAMLENGQ